MQPIQPVIQKAIASHLLAKKITSNDKKPVLPLREYRAPHLSRIQEVEHLGKWLDITI